jgi:hypothetical protein
VANLFAMKRPKRNAAATKAAKSTPALIRLNLMINAIVYDLFFVAFFNSISRIFLINTVNM